MLDLHNNELASVSGELAKLPSLAKHFERLHVDVKAVCSQWFLLVFVNVLPLESVLRVWDSFFIEGSSILFRVALAVLGM